MAMTSQRRFAYSGVIIVFLATYTFSHWIFGYYINGDQRYYIALYNELSRSAFEYIVQIQYRHTGSREPLYGIITWLAALYIEKKVFISIVNSIFISSMFVFLMRNRASYIFMFLLSTNYYILVLMTSAERLKFAYTFAILAVILPPVWRAPMVVGALLSHFSILITFLALLVPQRFQDVFRSLRGGGFGALKSILVLVITFSAFAIFFYLYQAPIIQKIGHYASYDYVDMGAAVLLFGAALLVTDDRRNMALTLSLPLIATFILGGQRVNMLTTSIFLYVIIKEGRTNHPAVLLIMGYLSLKSIDFMRDVLKYGTGFVL